MQEIRHLFNCDGPNLVLVGIMEAQCQLNELEKTKSSCFTSFTSKNANSLARWQFFNWLPRLHALGDSHAFSTGPWTFIMQLAHPPVMTPSIDMLDAIRTSSNSHKFVQQDGVMVGIWNGDGSRRRVAVATNSSNLPTDFEGPLHWVLTESLGWFRRLQISHYNSVVDGSHCATD